MKNKFISKILGALLLISSGIFNLIYAEPVPPAPPAGFGPGGGVGTVGPGSAPTTPINMYQVLLLVAAVMLIVYFVKKYKLKNI